MKGYYWTFLAGLFLFSCQQKKMNPISAEKDLIESLVGEYDNFQQAWQENTKEGLHKVKTEVLHKHVHTVIRETNHADWLYVKQYEGRDSSKVLAESGWHLSKSSAGFLVEEYEWKPSLLSMKELPKPSQQFQWEEDLRGFKAKIGEATWELTGDTLSIQGSQKGLFAHPDPYRMLRCRFFSGWIEYPLAEFPDSTYRMGNLRIHDQGGIVSLVLANGVEMDYSAELTQLVYGKQLSIMKLAIYHEPLSGIHFNSRSIAYTWTNPQDKRIGINIRSVSSGWTFIEPGMVNSNTMRAKK